MLHISAGLLSFVFEKVAFSLNFTLVSGAMLRYFLLQGLKLIFWPTNYTVQYPIMCAYIVLINVANV